MASPQNPTPNPDTADKAHRKIPDLHETHPDWEGFNDWKRENTPPGDISSAPPKFEGYGDSLPRNVGVSTDQDYKVLSTEEIDLSEFTRIDDGDGSDITEPAEMRPSVRKKAKSAKTDSTDGLHVLLFFNFIKGGEAQAEGSKTFDNINPARPNIPIGKFPMSAAADVNPAVQAAAGALPAWSSQSIFFRAEVLVQLAMQIEGQTDHLSDIIRRETGKLAHEARREVELATSLLKHVASLAHQPHGDSRELPHNSMRMWSRRRPLGVAAIFPPWNFPLAGLVRKLAPALLIGCTAVIKPHELTPHIAALLGLLLHHSGLPRGVVNIIHGKNEDLAMELCGSSDVDVVSFSGTMREAREVSALCARLNKCCHAETSQGGAAIVCEDADIKKAAKSILSAAVRFAGQEPASLSRAFIHREAYEEFKTALKSELSQLVVGSPKKTGASVGPMISYQLCERYKHSIEQAVEMGAELLEESGISTETSEEGYYVNPVVLETTSEDVSSAAYPEIVGPALWLVPVDDMAKAPALACLHRPAMVGVFTRDSRKAWRLSNELDSDMVMINRACPSYPYPMTPCDSTPNRMSAQIKEKDLLAFSKVQTVIDDLS